MDLGKEIKADANKLEAKAKELSTKIEGVVAKWYAENFHNSVVSRDTAVHNFIHATKPSLVAALVDAMQTKE